MKIDTSKITIVLGYLQQGGKVHSGGRDFVWLNEFVTHEDENYKWVIDGLAIEGRCYGPGEDWEDPNAGRPHFMGRMDMPLSNFFEMIEGIERKEYVRICRDFARIREEERIRINREISKL